MQSIIIRFIVFTSLIFVTSAVMAFQLKLDTSSLHGTQALVTYDLIDGTPDASKVKIDALQIDGASIGSNIFLEDLFFYNTFNQLITLGNELTLTFNLVEGIAPILGFFPDSFAIFLLDLIGFPLFSTADPTGSDSLLQWDLGVGYPIVYEGILSDPTRISEPPLLALILVGLMGLCSRRMRQVFYFILGGLIITYSSIVTAVPSLTTSTDLGAQVKMTASGLRFNRQTNTFDSALTILNTSQAEIKKPFTVAVFSLPNGVILSNATALSDEGIPLVSWESGNSLLPGNQISIVLKFVNQTNQAFPISFRLIRLEQPIPALALLQGPDANGNGVRDDLEPILGTRYTDIAQRNAAIQILRNMRNSFGAAGSVESAFNTILSLNKAFDCMFSLVQSEQAESEILFLRDEMMNNRERITAWITLTDMVAGQSVPIGTNNACEAQ